MKLSKNLSLDEVIYSQTALRRDIDNTPTEEHIENLKYELVDIIVPKIGEIACIKMESL